MHKRVSTLMIALCVTSLLFSFGISGVASAHSLSGTHIGTPTRANHLSLRMKRTSHTLQDPTWIAHKLAHQVVAVRGKDGRKTTKIVTSSRLSVQSMPTAYQLTTWYADQINEPPVSGTDAAGNGYTDDFMWDLCGPGASTAPVHQRSRWITGRR